MHETMIEIYERTKRNCLFYERENDNLHLLAEIGCLRGIAYCLENVGLCVHSDADFIRLIGVSNEIFKNNEVVRK